MQRFIRLSLLMVLVGMFGTAGLSAKPQAYESGTVASGDVRVFVKDSTYIIDRDYVISGTVIVEPGTEVLFYPNSRIIVAEGGRFIADGQAHATYEPGSLNPLGSGPYFGYADPNYFLNGDVIDVSTVEEYTVSRYKENVIYNVLYDTLNKVIKDLPNSASNPYYSRLDAVTGQVTSNPNEIIISHEQAIMLKASRISNYAAPIGDSIINIRPWTRLEGASVDVTPATITFKGQPTLNSSREWGHFVVLPGARAAFFRSCEFDNFRKELTVDRADFYTASDFANYATVNDKLNKMTNGAGGALTTLSSRTWLLECNFTNNMARLRGGAISVLEAPTGYPQGQTVSEYYAIDKNPQVVNRDMTPSDIIYDENNNRSKLLKIDCIDESDSEPLSDFDRQYYDDGRLAIYLGRMRNLTFEDNYTLISNTKVTADGVVDDKDEVADEFDAMGNRNLAAGGAMYISSRRESSFGITGGHDGKYIEFALGCNDVIKMGGSEVNLYSNSSANFQRDAFVAKNNFSESYDDAGEGSMGGAIYLSYGSSLIFSGQLDANSVEAPYHAAAEKARGGAIFVENCPGARLQFRGNPAKSEGSNPNPTHITNNTARLGGAVFVDGYSETIPASPIIGGSDALIATRDWGFDIIFEGNMATAEGGAIYTTRQMTINGAGGVEGNSLIGYGGLYPVKFINNKANFSGGAIKSFIPPYDVNGKQLPVAKRITTMARAEFTGNEAGVSVENDDYVKVAGGGAIAAVYTELTEVKGVLFEDNKVMNGNGAAVYMVQVDNKMKHAWVTDLDEISRNHDGSVYGFTSVNDVFTHDNSEFPADVRMMTRFINNTASVEVDAMDGQMGSGTTQYTKGAQQPTNDLFAVGYNGSAAFAGGANGMFIKIPDGSEDWDIINLGISNTIEDVYFTTATHGFFSAANGVLGMTQDGGTNWSVKTINNQIGAIKDIDFNGTSFGVGISELGYFLKTTDAGANWTYEKITAIGAKGLAAITAVDKNLIIAAGENGVILKSADGGATWNAVNLIGKANHYNAIAFVSSTKGFAVADGGLLIKTENAGDSWTEVFEKGSSLKEIAFSSDMIGYAFGLSNTCYITEDGGATWNDMTTIAGDAGWYAASFSGKAGGVVGTNGTVMTTNDYGKTWFEETPDFKGVEIDVVRYNRDCVALPENGIGLGGAIYVVDDITWDEEEVEKEEQEMFVFNRVRMIENEAYTGSAIYSDNYNVNFVFNRSLVTKNVATSEIAKDQNVINGPMTIDANHASSDLAGATIYGAVQGPLPASIYSEAANSIYDNNARFLIRLPDAPNTKGLLAGDTPGIGFGGTVELQGNYWGETQANVTMDVTAWNRADNTTNMETFFVAGQENTTWLGYLYNAQQREGKVLGYTQAQYANLYTGNLKDQGPFESIDKFMYLPIPLENDAADITLPNANSIPENLLFSGKIYDIYDKGTDIKTADYANRRMSPIEDFAVGIPPKLRDRANGPYSGGYVTKWTRNPEVAEMVDPATGDLMYPAVAELQTEYFAPDSNGVDHHAIGYPLYLQANVDYSGDENRTNHNDMFLNESVFFVINETNNDFIRVNLKQQGEEAPYREVFRNTVELVPDQSLRTGDTDKNRYINRRLDEGLKTLGNGADMLRALTVNPYNEDFATLKGRKYIYDKDELGLNHNLPTMLVNDLFSNRNNMPTSNQDGTESMTTYFAGERYRALPVKVGDTVRVISRTKLWRIEDESEIDAVMAGGLKFVVSESTLIPEFTGDVVALQNNEETIIVPSDKPWKDYDTITVDQFKNKVFIKEDLEAPAEKEILAVTAIDSVDMYDPRAKWAPADYPELGYEWEVEDGSGLSFWLSSISYNADREKDGAKGYIEFQGRPINPFVVPGGEKVTVRTKNWSPTYRLIDELKKDGRSDEEIANFIETYPEYFNAMAYDFDPNNPTDNARYLQQDTLDVGSKYESEYEFEVFVVDSVPQFLAWDDTEETINRLDDPTVEYVTYKPSEYGCSYEDEASLEQFLIANVTDKLRFQMDINTDDECEDYSPAAANWDFRYGMTSYGFMNIVKSNEGNDEDIYDGVLSTRPAWMSDDYIMVYDSEDQQDIALADFTTRGKLNVRLDKAEALALLNPYKDADENHTGYMTSDTVFTVIANDGHSGVASKQYHVKVNYQPEIITEALPDATENQKYNNWLDNGGMFGGVRIEVKDANLDQVHKFRLLYDDAVYADLGITNPGDEWQKDPCFVEADKWDLAANKGTPSWLRINSETGVLYGTPTMEDFQDMAQESITQKVTVLVTDVIGGQEMLSDMKTFDLVLHRANNAPEILQSMATICVEDGGDFEDYIKVKDLDLLRDGEELTLKVMDAATNTEVSEITVEPSVITAADDTDGDGIVDVKISGKNVKLTPNTGYGKMLVNLVLTDKYSATSAPIVSYAIGLSGPVDFVANIQVENSNSAFQVLQFGTSSEPGVTVGDGTNDEDLGEGTGNLDYEWCEFELPPTPPSDVFDARWRIPLRNGTLRNIHPYSDGSKFNRSVYEADFQAGGVTGQGSTAYPVTIKWNPNDIPAHDDLTLNPAGGTWTIKDAHSNGQIFRTDMARPDDDDYSFYASNITMGWDPDNSDLWVITISRSDITGFVIDYEFAGAAVNESGITATEIIAVSPNPMTMTSAANIQFSVLEATNLTIDVVDNMGRVVTTLNASEFYTNGIYEIAWDGKDDNNNEVVSGQYMIRLNANGEVSTYPVVIVK